MRITKLLLICLCCVLDAPAVWGQAANAPARPGILGYLDPHTGAFRPLPSADEAAALEPPPPLTTFGGTITVTLTITLKTTVLTNITCSAEVSVSDAITTVNPRFIGETDTVAATGTGTSRTCVLRIPYSWALVSQSSDMMSTSYIVYGATGTTGLPQRTSQLSPLDNRKVPINGTVTALTANVTL